MKLLLPTTPQGRLLRPPISARHCIGRSNGPFNSSAPACASSECLNHIPAAIGRRNHALKGSTWTRPAAAGRACGACKAAIINSIVYYSIASPQCDGATRIAATAGSAMRGDMRALADVWRHGIGRTHPGLSTALNPCTQPQTIRSYLLAGHVTAAGCMPALRKALRSRLCGFG